MRKMFIRKLDSKIPKISILKCLKQVPLGKLIKYSNPCFIGFFFFFKKKKKNPPVERDASMKEGGTNTFSLRLISDKFMRIAVIIFCSFEKR